MCECVGCVRTEYNLSSMSACNIEQASEIGSSRRRWDYAQLNRKEQCKLKNREDMKEELSLCVMLIHVDCLRFSPNVQCPQCHAMQMSQVVSRCPLPICADLKSLKTPEK